MEIMTGRQPGPRKTLWYATHGFGKSMLLASLPGHLILPTEDGLDDIDCRRFPVAKTFGQFLEAVEKAGSIVKPGEWFCIDSLDWMYRLITKQVCADKNIQNLSDLTHGRAYSAVYAHFESVLTILDGFHAKGVHIGASAHSQVSRLELPDKEAYDRYEPRLQKTCSGIAQEWFYDVIFGNYLITTKKEKGDFGKERNLAIGQGKRVMYTTEMPSHLAKNRCKLPPVLPMGPEGAGAEPYLKGVAAFYEGKAATEEIVETPEEASDSLFSK